MQYQARSLYNLALYQVQLQYLIPKSSYCPEIIFFIFNNSDLELYQGLQMQYQTRSSFLTQLSSNLLRMLV
jgi:hypothetical protein